MTVTLNGNTLSSIVNGSYTLVSGTDYTVTNSGGTVTINMSYLLTLAVSTYSLVFNFSAGNTQTLDLTVEDTTPANSTISPTSATFDLYTGDATLNAAIPVTVTLNGNTLSSIVNGSYTLVSGTDYTVTNSGGTVTINMSYLFTLAVSTYSLVFNFSAGNTQTLDLTVEDTTPANSTISPTSATFDLYTGDATLNAAIPVTVTLNGNTLSSIVNGSYTLVSGTDYTVTNSGGTVTINMSYLLTLAVSTYSLVFNFSAGNTQTLDLTVEDTTPANSTISPTSATFDLYTGDATLNAAIPVTVTLNGNTLSSIVNGSYTLVSGTDYTVTNSGGTVTINMSYLSTLAVSTYSLVFNFSAGNTQTLDLTVEDTTPANSTISPTSATFDLYTGDATLNAAIPVTVTLNGNTLSSIVNGSYTLVSGTDYTVTNSGGTVTINMSYLSTLAVSTYSLVFNFSAGNTQTLDLTVEDTTPANSTISPTSATFDLYTGDATLNAAIPVTVTLNGNTLSSIVNGSYTLVSGTDYTVTNSGGTVTINMSYLLTLAVSTYSLVFNFSAGNTQTLDLTVEDTTPANSTISPTSATFDLYTGDATLNAAIPVTVTLNGNTLSSIVNGSYTLVSGTDYTVTNSGGTVTINMSYLSTLAVSTYSLVFNFSAGNTQTLDLTVEDTTPANSTISPTSATFDLYTGDATLNAAIPVTVTLNGNTLSSIVNGSYTLVSGTDYTVTNSGGTVTINMSYLSPWQSARIPWCSTSAPATRRPWI